MAKWTLITGASAGIGEATARELFSKGHNLILVARRMERLKNLRQDLLASVPSTTEREIIIEEVDVTNPHDIDQFVAKHSPTLQTLNVLINNAGLAKGTDKVQDARREDWELMIDTNIRGLLHFTRAVLPFFVAKKQGHIVNLGSVAGRWTYPGGAVYCATKFAVRAFSEGLRMDLSGSNIQVSNIEPGMVETEFSRVRLGSVEKSQQVYAGMKPLTAKDIAETIAWVVSRPEHVNVQELVIFPTDQASVRDVHRQG